MGQFLDTGATQDSERNFYTAPEVTTSRPRGLRAPRVGWRSRPHRPGPGGGAEPLLPSATPLGPGADRGGRLEASAGHPGGTRQHEGLSARCGDRSPAAVTPEEARERLRTGTPAERRAILRLLAEEADGRVTPAVASLLHTEDPERRAGGDDALADLEPVRRPCRRRALRRGAPRDGSAGLAGCGGDLQPGRRGGPDLRRRLEQTRHGALPGDALRHVHRRLRAGGAAQPYHFVRCPVRVSVTRRSASFARRPAASGTRCGSIPGSRRFGGTWPRRRPSWLAPTGTRSASPRWTRRAQRDACRSPGRRVRQRFHREALASP